MVVLRTLLCILGVAVIAGCASTSAPKPNLEDYAYDEFAYSVVGTHKCVESGQLSSAAGATGLRLDQAELAKWSVDRERLRTNFNRLDSTLKPTAEWCRSKALQIAQQRNETPTYSQSTQNNAGWADLFASFSTFNQRNYVTNPITSPVSPQTIQPNTKNVGGEEYQTIMVNTPSGLVSKRCKVLNGQIVACF